MSQITLPARTLIQASAIAWLVALSALPAADNAFDFDSRGVRLHVEDTGDGPPVMLAHGFAGRATSWQDAGVTQALAKAGFRVVSYDHRGHGRSAKPHEADQYGQAMVDDIERLLDHLDIERIHLVGYSMGAVVAHQFREQHPQRLLSVVLSGYGEPETPTEFSPQLVDEISKNLERMQLARDNDAEALAHLCVGWREWNVPAQRLELNKVPCLVLMGQDDQFLAQARSLSESLAMAKFVLVPGDHGSARRHVDFASALIHWLREQNLGTTAER